VTETNELPTEYIDTIAMIQARALVMAARDPKLPYASAWVMAADYVGGDLVLEKLERGELTWQQAEPLIGSYARLDARLKARARGLITTKQALHDLPGAWSGSDPDDTKEPYLALWREAWEANGRVMLRDSNVTVPDRNYVRVFRGQDRVDGPRTPRSFGIAWSLSKATARKFAMGAATRQGNREGVIYTALVQPRDIYGFMTQRGEREVIIDPANLVHIEEL